MFLSCEGAQARSLIFPHTAWLGPGPALDRQRMRPVNGTRASPGRLVVDPLLDWSGHADWI